MKSDSCGLSRLPKQELHPLHQCACRYGQEYRGQPYGQPDNHPRPIAHGGHGRRVCRKPGNRHSLGEAVGEIGSDKRTVYIMNLPVLFENGCLFPKQDGCLSPMVKRQRCYHSLEPTAWKTPVHFVSTSIDNFMNFITLDKIAHSTHLIPGSCPGCKRPNASHTRPAPHQWAAKRFYASRYVLIRRGAFQRVPANFFQEP